MELNALQFPKCPELILIYHIPQWKSSGLQFRGQKLSASNNNNGNNNYKNKQK